MDLKNPHTGELVVTPEHEPRGSAMVKREAPEPSKPEPQASPAFVRKLLDERIAALARVEQLEAILIDLGAEF